MKILRKDERGYFYRRLGFWDLLAYGIASIIGAGIYALIAPAAAIAESYVWLSFIFAWVITLLLGLNYARISSKFSYEAGEYFIVRELTKSRFFSFLVAWLAVTAQIVGIAAVSLGFGGYLSTFLPLPPILSAVLLIFLSFLIEFRGIEEVSRLNFLLVSITVLGLLVVGFSGIFKGNAKLILSESFSLTNTLEASMLLFFAFIGFEGIINLGGEAKNPKRDIPRAIVISIIISGALYTLVAFSSVSLVGWKNLSESTAPLALAASSSLGSIGFWFVNFCALFSTASTVLILSTVSPRLIWGLAKDGFFPSLFLKVRKNTPIVPAFLVFLFSVIFVLTLRKISTIAEIASFNMLVVYAVFSFLSFSFSKDIKGKIIGGAAVWLVFLLLTFTSPDSLFVCIIDILIGLGLYKILGRTKV